MVLAVKGFFAHFSPLFPIYGNNQQKKRMLILRKRVMELDTPVQCLTMFYINIHK